MEKMMVNHPTRSQKSQDAAIRRLIIKYKLNHIGITVDGNFVAAQAYPTRYSPIYEQRRQELLGERDWSMGERDEIHNKAMGPFALCIGSTIEEAIGKLTAELA